MGVHLRGATLLQEIIGGSQVKKLFAMFVLFADADVSAGMSQNPLKRATIVDRPVRR